MEDDEPQRRHPAGGAFTGEVANMLRSVMLFAAATVCGAPAIAQTAQDAATRQPVGRFILSAGTDALARDFGDAAPGIAAHAGYERQIGGTGSPFALRIAGDYWRTGRMFTADLNDGQGSIDVRRTTTIVGGSLLGVLRLPTYRALRPYALAGVGVEQYANRNETDWVPTGVNTAWKIVYLPPVRLNTISYTGGVGASANVGRLMPFIEARIMVLPALDDIGVQSVRAPLTLGVRF
jgi:opacity protein-like surface antigen